ncbi:lipopolysaccharide biosynthesis protein [Alistipes indistinctus]|uniref:lipopolysaccharide biosynthesis protein n=2 Tax=Alistipes TaxID=239759 RepID=UPI0026DAEBA9|nr:lipopolysaccharide biosynthesis protein [Alistipes indistinctus]
MTGESLKTKAVKSVMWSSIERFSVQGIQFILSIVIARLVTPSEYGLIAMLSIFLAIAQTFIDSGFSNALIQKQGRTETDNSTVFYFNIAVSIIVYGMLYGAAPFIADFYKEPLLTTVTRWIGLNIIISAFSIVQRAILIIKLDFKTQAKASLIAVILSGGVGIAFAYYGYGVWALVIQAIASNFINTFLLWIFAKWTPAFRYSWQSFRTLFAFGSKLLLSGLLHTIYVNLYNLVIGRKFSAMDLGYYNRASTFAQFPSINITSILTRAIYPIQCQLQDDDERLNATFIQYIRISSFVIFPLMTGLCVLSEPFIRLFLSDKWLESVPLLQILCIAYVWFPIMAINNNILNVKGRSDYFLKAEIVKKMVAVGILIATIPWGLKILCWGLVLYSFCDMAVIIHYAKKVISTSYIKQIKNIFPILLLSVIMGTGMYLTISLVRQPFLQLLLGGVVGILLYCVIAITMKFEEFNLLYKYIRHKSDANDKTL